jgi:Protein of unknown function (DUF2523)
VPFLISLISGFVTSTVIRALLMRALVALGISAVTYTGLTIAMAAIVSHVNANLGAGAAGTLTILTMCKVPQALNVVMSAYAGGLILRGLTAVGGITKMGISSAAGTVFSPGTF